MPTLPAFRLRSALADSYGNIGFRLSETGKLADALKAHESALTIRQELADAHPSVTEFQEPRTLRPATINLGLLLRATGQLDAAGRPYESALAIQQKLADANPSVTEYQSNLAASHNNLGDLL